MKIWPILDRVWLALGSVKITLIIFVSLLLLSIPGTLILQENVSSVDPGLQYDYEFWHLGQVLQLFHSYHSFWYVGLIVILAVNLIICSYERWPQMWRMAFAKPVALGTGAVELKPEEHRFSTETDESDFKRVKKAFAEWADKRWLRYEVIRDSEQEWQVFWQKNKFSRMANYIVHTSLLIIFAGAIWSGLYGFEGTLNIPEGAAVDTFLMFKEGGDAGLERPPGSRGLPNERMLDVRIEAAHFNVEFYPDFPGRPKEFATRLNVIDRGTGAITLSKTIRVNDPMEIGKYTFYQASYGELGDYRLDFRFVRKASLRNTGSDSFFEDQAYISGKLGQVQKQDKMHVSFVPIKFLADVQGHGPGVQVQEVKGDDLVGAPFWVLKNDPVYDFGRDSAWALILDDFKPLYFTGLQLAYDPGAPVYWFGCFGMLLGTFYALFFQHKKFYFIARKSGAKKISFTFTGSTHRLPYSFEKELKKLNAEISDNVVVKDLTEGNV